MQEFVCKDVSAAEIVASVENLRRAAPSIDPFVSWLSGLPGETRDDMEQTFDLMDAMGRANPRTQHYGIFLYTPFPSPLLAALPAEFTPPRSLEEWGAIEVFHFEPPWHSRAYVDWLRAVSAVTRYAFSPESRIAEHGLAFRAAYRTLNARGALPLAPSRTSGTPSSSSSPTWRRRGCAGFSRSRADRERRRVRQRERRRVPAGSPECGRVWWR